jgi:hypothetical protein
LRLRMPSAPPPVFLEKAPSVLLPNEPCLWSVRSHPGINALRLTLSREGAIPTSKTLLLSPGQYLLSATCDAPVGGALDWELSWLDEAGNAVATEKGSLVAP